MISNGSLLVGDQIWRVEFFSAEWTAKGCTSGSREDRLQEDSTTHRTPKQIWLKDLPNDEALAFTLELWRSHHEHILFSLADEVDLTEFDGRSVSVR